MKRIVIKHLLLSLGLFFLPFNGAIAMEPDVETLSNPQFVAKFHCLTDHFLIEGLFEKEAWYEAMRVIEGLERKGYADRALAVAKGKIFFKTGQYDKALASFQSALEQKYKCHWTSYRLTYPPLHDLADEGILWYYIYQVYLAMDVPSKADVAYRTSFETLMKSLDLPTSNIEDKKNAKVTIGKIFSVYDLYRKPLRPFNPWSQDHKRR